MMNKKQLGIYIHIPFCVQKCVYCDFLSAPADESTKKKYVKALIEEIKQSGAGQAYREKDKASRVSAKDMDKSTTKMDSQYQVKSIFFGGGTPSILDAEQISAILDAVRDTFDVDEFAEITIECNPGTLDDKKTFGYRQCGINRLSFGLQSAVDSELSMLGRIHNLKDFESSFNMARKYGFNNINVDIMSAIPGQTMASYEHTLNSVIAYRPEHISAYSLIVEENTYLEQHLNQYPALPDEDLEREMYHQTKAVLEQAGYHQYEISNYSKLGYECQHNLSYWERKDYLGCGIGAASLFQETRYHNCRDLKQYLKAAGNPALIREEQEVLTVDDQMEEFMFLGLRKISGVDEREFKRIFGKTIEEIYKVEIDKNIENGLLEKADRHYRLTSLGIDISNTVMADFML